MRQLVVFAVAFLSLACAIPIDPNEPQLDYNRVKLVYHNATTGAEPHIYLIYFEF